MSPAAAPRVLARSERVRFLPLQHQHIHTHFQWNNDPELNRLDSELPFEKETFSLFKRRFEGMMRQPHDRYFEIHAEDNGLIGVAYIVEISEANRHATVGVTIGDRDYWGKGYGREAMNLVLQECFEEFNLHRVRAEAFAYNEAWQHLVEGMGFTREGVERDYLRRDEQYYDRFIYALLEEEYEPHVQDA